MQPPRQNRTISSPLRLARLAVAAALLSIGHVSAQFTPGARTMGDPYLPTLGNGGYEVQHYNLTINYHPATNGMVSTADLTIRATQNLSEFSLDLRGFPQATATIDGVPAGVAQTADKLIITPAVGIEQERVFHAVVNYSGRPSAIPLAGGGTEGWVRTTDGGMAIGEPRGAMGWFPNNNYPSDKATFEFHITVPNTHTALGNGELVSKVDNGDGTSTWNWQMDYPMATYLSTSTVGLFDYAESTSTSAVGASGDPLEIYDAFESALPAAQKTAAVSAIGRQDAIIKFISDELGAPFPFNSTGVVLHRNSLIPGGLEVQTKIHLIWVPIDPVELAHEIAHQWFGDSVSPATWREVWFNEGWATWWHWYWSNRQNGDTNSVERQFALNYSASGQPWSTAPANLPSAAEMFSWFPNYVRPAMMLEAYRQIVGHTTFFAFQHALVTQYAYSSITEAQFIALAKRLAGERSYFGDTYLTQLDKFFDQWLHGRTKPTLTPTTFFQDLQPRMVMRLISARELEIAWPQNKAQFVLEESENVNDPVWTPVPSSLTTTDGVTRTTLVPPAVSRFYRLRQQ